MWARSMNERAWPVVVVVGIGAVLGIAAFLILDPGGDKDESTAVAAVTTTNPPKGDGKVPPPEPVPAATTTSAVPLTTTTTLPVRDSDTIPGWTVGEPWGTVNGLTMFRGNPTRTFYGTGPLSSLPSEVWRYPDAQMCSSSSAGGVSKIWCGMGWTGQPVVYKREDGRTELIFGALHIDIGTQQVIVDEKSIELTAYEYRVLEYLVLRAGQVVSKSELTEHIYDQDFDRDSNVIEVFIGRLRRKLDPEGTLNVIETLRGRGYRFALTPTSESRNA